MTAANLNAAVFYYPKRVNEYSRRVFMNEFAKWKMALAVWFGTLLFLFLGAVVFYAQISAEAKVAIAMTLTTVFATIMYAYWRKTSEEEKINPDSSTEDGTSPKANSPVTGGQSAVQGWGQPCQSCGTESSDQSDYTMDDETPPAPIDKVNDIISGLFYDLQEDGVKSTPAAVASRVVSWLGAHQNEIPEDEQKDLIAFGLDLAKKAYKTTTGLNKVPAKYSEVADYNKWWRENQKACKAPKGEARAVLMTLRDLLKRSEAL